MNRKEFYKAVSDYEESHLKHFGIAGQKWGLRRWQNRDGTFNEAGKERYFGKSEKDEKESIRNCIDDIIKGGYKFKGPYDPEYASGEKYKRMLDSTSLAYEAEDYLSSKLDYGQKFDDLSDEDKRLEIFWFAYEDQTIGMWRVADMINQGVPLDKVNKLIKIAEDSDQYFSYRDNDARNREENETIFSFFEGNYNSRLEIFAEKCDKVKKERDKKG